MKTAEGMRFVAILAGGLGFAVWAHRRMVELGEVGTGVLRPKSLLWVFFGVSIWAELLIVGCYLVTAIFIWTELIRRQRKEPWGAGRWSISAGALFLLVRFPMEFRYQLLSYWTRGQLMSSDTMYRILFEYVFSIDYQVPLALIACALSARLAGWKGDAKPDAMEWFGRLLLIATLVNEIGFTLSSFWE